MNEAQYRAEMAKQARIANLIALRDIMRMSTVMEHVINKEDLTRAIKRELEV